MAGQKKKKEKKQTLTLTPKESKKPLTISGVAPSELKRAEAISLDKPEKKKRRERKKKEQPAPVSAPEKPASPQVVAPTQVSASPQTANASFPQSAISETAPVADRFPRRRIVVTFVCTGNTCRSAMAQYLFAEFVRKQGMDGYFEICGAGLSAFEGADMSEYAKYALAERGINGFYHTARRLTAEQVDRSDIVVCMTEAHLRAIGNRPNVTTVSRVSGGGEVADPYGGTLEDYRRTADYLEYACRDIYDAAMAAYKARTAAQ